MATIRAAVIQAHANMPKERAIEKHVGLIAKAAADGAQITCLQEIFHGPYFPAEQDPKWYASAEPEDGPTVTRMRQVARDHNMVLIVPFYEEAQVGPCFWEKYYFKPGNLGYPAFDTSVGRIGLIICYDRHFPEVARQLGLKGAELVFNPSATVESLSRYLWELEQPAPHRPPLLWVVLLLQPAGQDRGPGIRLRGRGARVRRGPRHEPRGPQHVAVPAGPPAGD